MKKIKGGILVRWTTGMTPVSLNPECIAAVRDGTMLDEWYGDVVDEAFRLGRERAIEQLRHAVQYEVGALDRVVDRRPSTLRLHQGAL